MKELLTFDDVLIIPKFSTLKSRKDVNISSEVDGLPFLKVPVISANMDTVTEVRMAKEMRRLGGAGCLHRFMPIQDNVKMFQDSIYKCELGQYAPIVSVGLGNSELERAEALFAAGARYFCIDVAHGATMEVVKQVNRLAEDYGEDICLTVGNFATGDSVKTFLEHCKIPPKAFKVGIGPGSACTTRVKTGVGYPQLSAIIDCVEKNPGVAFIADGGIKTPGDIAKALAAGAKCVMLGGMLAGTAETPGETKFYLKNHIIQDPLTPKEWEDKVGYNFDYLSKSFGPINSCKQYRGSASKESYQMQGKDESWRTAEGEAFLVPYKGYVEAIMKDIEGGLRSAFTYVGASNLEEFQQKAEFVRISNSTVKENGAHGKV